MSKPIKADLIFLKDEKVVVKTNVGQFVCSLDYAIETFLLPIMKEEVFRLYDEKKGGEE